MTGATHRDPDGRGSTPSSSSTSPPSPPTPLTKQQTVERLLAAKALSRKTLTQIAAEVRITNAYCGQLFLRQTPLRSDSLAKRLRAAVPALTAADVERMRAIPERTNDAAAAVLHEPAARRLHDIIGHYAGTVKMLVDEALGDGVMSAEDFFMRLDTVKGSRGEDRVLIVMDGRFAPVAEQIIADSVAGTDSFRSLSAVPMPVDAAEAAADAEAIAAAAAAAAAVDADGGEGDTRGSGGGGSAASGRVVTPTRARGRSRRRSTPPPDGRSPSARGVPRAASPAHTASGSDGVPSDAGRGEESVETGSLSSREGGWARGAARLGDDDGSSGDVGATRRVLAEVESDGDVTTGSGSWSGSSGSASWSQPTAEVEEGDGANARYGGGDRGGGDGRATGRGSSRGSQSDVAGSRRSSGASGSAVAASPRLLPSGSATSGGMSGGRTGSVASSGSTRTATEFAAGQGGTIRPVQTVRDFSGGTSPQPTLSGRSSAGTAAAAASMRESVSGRGSTGSAAGSPRPAGSVGGVSVEDGAPGTPPRPTTRSLHGVMPGGTAGGSAVAMQPTGSSPLASVGTRSRPSSGSGGSGSPASRRWSPSSSPSAGSRADNKTSPGYREPGGDYYSGSVASASSRGSGTSASQRFTGAGAAALATSPDDDEGLASDEGVGVLGPGACRSLAPSTVPSVPPSAASTRRQQGSSRVTSAVFAPSDADGSAGQPLSGAGVAAAAGSDGASRPSLGSPEPSLLDEHNVVHGSVGRADSRRERPGQGSTGHSQLSSEAAEGTAAASRTPFTTSSPGIGKADSRLSHGGHLVAVRPGLGVADDGHPSGVSGFGTEPGVMLQGGCPEAGSSSSGRGSLSDASGDDWRHGRAGSSRASIDDQQRRESRRRRRSSASHTRHDQREGLRDQRAALAAPRPQRRARSASLGFASGSSGSRRGGRTGRHDWHEENEAVYGRGRRRRRWHPRETYSDDVDANINPVPRSRREHHWWDDDGRFDGRSGPRWVPRSRRLTSRSRHRWDGPSYRCSYDNRTRHYWLGSHSRHDSRDRRYSPWSRDSRSWLGSRTGRRREESPRTYWSDDDGGFRGWGRRLSGRPLSVDGRRASQDGGGGLPGWHRRLRDGRSLTDGRASRDDHGEFGHRRYSSDGRSSADGRMSQEDDGGYSGWRHHLSAGRSSADERASGDDLGGLRSRRRLWSDGRPSAAAGLLDDNRAHVGEVLSDRRSGRTSRRELAATPPPLLRDDDQRYRRDDQRWGRRSSDGGSVSEHDFSEGSSRREDRVHHGGGRLPSTTGGVVGDLGGSDGSEGALALDDRHSHRHSDRRSRRDLPAFGVPSSRDDDHWPDDEQLDSRSRGGVSGSPDRVRRSRRHHGHGTTVGGSDGAGGSGVSGDAGGFVGRIDSGASVGASRSTHDGSQGIRGGSSNRDSYVDDRRFDRRRGNRSRRDVSSGGAPESDGDGDDVEGSLDRRSGRSSTRGFSAQGSSRADDNVDDGLDERRGHSSRLGNVFGVGSDKADADDDGAEEGRSDARRGSRSSRHGFFTGGSAKADGDNGGADEGRSDERRGSRSSRRGFFGRGADIADVSEDDDVERDVDPRSGISSERSVSAGGSSKAVDSGTGGDGAFSDRHSGRTSERGMPAPDGPTSRDVDRRHRRDDQPWDRRSSDGGSVSEQVLSERSTREGRVGHGRGSRSSGTGGGSGSLGGSGGSEGASVDGGSQGIRGGGSKRDGHVDDERFDRRRRGHRSRRVFSAGGVALADVDGDDMAGSSDRRSGRNSTRGFSAGGSSIADDFAEGQSDRHSGISVQSPPRALRAEVSRRQDVARSKAAVLDVDGPDRQAYGRERDSDVLAGPDDASADGSRPSAGGRRSPQGEPAEVGGARVAEPDRSSAGSTDVTRSFPQQTSPAVASDGDGQPLQSSTGSPGEHELARQESVDERDLDFSGELQLDGDSRQSGTKDGDTHDLDLPDAPPTVTTDSYAFEAQQRALELEREMERDRRLGSAAGSRGGPSPAGGSRPSDSSPPRSAVDSQSSTHSYLYESSSVGYSATPSDSVRSSARQRGSSSRRSTASGSGAALTAGDQPGPVAISAEQQQLERQQGAQHTSWQQRYLAMHAADIEADEERLREERRSHELAPAAEGDQRVFEFETDGLPDVSVSPPPSFYSLSAASESVASHRVGRPPPLSPVQERPASEQVGAGSGGRGGAPSASSSHRHGRSRHSRRPSIGSPARSDEQSGRGRPSDTGRRSGSAARTQSSARSSDRTDEDLTRDTSDLGTGLYSPARPVSSPVVSGSRHDRTDGRTQPAAGDPTRVDRISRGSSSRRPRPTGAGVASRPRSHRSSPHSERLSVASGDVGSSRSIPLRSDMGAGGMPAARPGGSASPSQIESASPVQSYRSSMVDDDGGSVARDQGRAAQLYPRPMSVKSGEAGEGGSGRPSSLPSTPPETPSPAVHTVDDTSAAPSGSGASPPLLSRSSGRRSGRRPSRPSVAEVPAPEGVAADDESVRRDVPPSLAPPSVDFERPGQPTEPVAPSPSVASTLPSFSVVGEDGLVDRPRTASGRRPAAATGLPVNVSSPSVSRLTSAEEEQPPSPARVGSTTRPPSRPPSSASRRFSLLGSAAVLATSGASGGAASGQSAEPPASPPHLVDSTTRAGADEAGGAVVSARRGASTSTTSRRSSLSRHSSGGGGGPPGDESASKRPVPAETSLDGRQGRSGRRPSVAAGSTLDSGAARRRQPDARKPPLQVDGSASTTRRARHHGRTPSGESRTPPSAVATRQVRPPAVEALPDSPGVLTHVSGSSFFSGDTGLTGGRSPSFAWWPVRQSSAASAAIRAETRSATSSRQAAVPGGGSDVSAAASRPSTEPPRHQRRHSRSPRAGGRAPTAESIAAALRRRRSLQQTAGEAASSTSAPTATPSSSAAASGGDGAQPRHRLPARRASSGGAAEPLPAARDVPVSADAAPAVAAAAPPAPEATYGQPWTGQDEASSHSTSLSVGAAVTTTTVEPLVERLVPVPRKSRPAVAPVPATSSLLPSPPVPAALPAPAAARLATTAGSAGATTTRSAAAAPKEGVVPLAAGAGGAAVRAGPSGGAAVKRHRRGSPRQVTHAAGGDSGGSSGASSGGGSSGAAASDGGSAVDVRPRARRRTAGGGVATADVSAVRLPALPRGDVRVPVPRPPLPPRPPVAPAAPAVLWSSLEPLPALPPIPALPPLESVGSEGSATTFTCVEVGDRQVSGTVVVRNDPGGFEYTQVSWSC